MRSGWRRVAYARTVLFNLDDGTAIRGVLIRQHGGLLVITKAILLADGKAPLPSPVELDGDVIIDAAKVRFGQMTS